MRVFECQVFFSFFRDGSQSNPTPVPHPKLHLSYSQSYTCPTNKPTPVPKPIPHLSPNYCRARVDLQQEGHVLRASLLRLLFPPSRCMQQKGGTFLSYSAANPLQCYYVKCQASESTFHGALLLKTFRQ